MTPEQEATLSYPTPHGEHDLIVPVDHFNALAEALSAINRAFYAGNHEGIRRALEQCKRDIGACCDKRRQRLFPEVGED